MSKTNEPVSDGAPTTRRSFLEKTGAGAAALAAYPMSHEGGNDGGFFSGLFSSAVDLTVMHDGEVVSHSLEELNIEGTAVQEVTEVNAYDGRIRITLAGGSGGGAFEDTDGDGVAELQDDHVDLQGGDARNVGSLGASSVNSAVYVESASEFETECDVNDNYVIVPPGTTINIETVDQFRPAGTGLHLWVQNGATIRMGDGVDLGNVLQLKSDDQRIRIDGVIDANRANQSSGMRAAIDINDCDDTIVYGNGETRGTEKYALQFRDGGNVTNRCEYRGLTITDHFASADGQQAVRWAGNTNWCGVRNLRLEGGTWDTSTAEADGLGAGSSSSHTFARGCVIESVPRRGIIGVEYVHNNFINNIAGPGGGGDAIFTFSEAIGNVLVGTYDANGDNGIVIEGMSDWVCSDNWVEGFSGNGIHIYDGAGAVDNGIIGPHVLKNNNQDGDTTASASNGLWARAPNANGVTDVVIEGPIIAVDDQGTATQDVGVEVESSVGNGVRVGRVIAEGNVSADVNIAAGVPWKGLAQEATGGTAPAGTYPTGTIVEDTDNAGDAYILLRSGSWTQIST